MIFPVPNLCDTNPNFNLQSSIFRIQDWKWLKYNDTNNREIKFCNTCWGVVGSR